MSDVYSGLGVIETEVAVGGVFAMVRVLEATVAPVAVPSLADHLSLVESSLLSAALAGGAAVAVLALTADPVTTDVDRPDVDRPDLHFPLAERTTAAAANASSGES